MTTPTRLTLEAVRADPKAYEGQVLYLVNSRWHCAASHWPARPDAIARGWTGKRMFKARPAGSTGPFRKVEGG